MKNDNGKNSSDKKQLFKEAFQNFKSSYSNRTKMIGDVTPKINKREKYATVKWCFEQF